MRDQAKLDRLLKALAACNIRLDRGIDPWERPDEFVSLLITAAMNSAGVDEEDDDDEEPHEVTQPVSMSADLDPAEQQEVQRRVQQQRGTDRAIRKWDKLTGRR